MAEEIEPEQIFSCKDGISSLIWSPNSQMILFTLKKSNELFFIQVDYNSELNKYEWEKAEALEDSAGNSILGLNPSWQPIIA